MPDRLRKILDLIWTCVAVVVLLLGSAVLGTVLERWIAGRL